MRMGFVWGILAGTAVVAALGWVLSALVAPPPPGRSAVVDQPSGRVVGAVPNRTESIDNRGEAEKPAAEVAPVAAPPGEGDPAAAGDPGAVPAGVTTDPPVNLGATETTTAGPTDPEAGVAGEAAVEDRLTAITPPAPAASADSLAAPDSQPVPATEATTQPPTDPTAPSFDIVRVNQAGQTIVAGRAQPEQTVEVLLDGEVVETVQADGTGRFVAVLTADLSGEARQLQLRVGVPDATSVASAAAPARAEAGTMATPRTATQARAAEVPSKPAAPSTAGPPNSLAGLATPPPAGTAPAIMPPDQPQGDAAQAKSGTAAAFARPPEPDGEDRANAAEGTASLPAPASSALPEIAQPDTAPGRAVRAELAPGAVVRDQSGWGVEQGTTLGRAPTADGAPEAQGGEDMPGATVGAAGADGDGKRAGAEVTSGSAPGSTAPERTGLGNAAGVSIGTGLAQGAALPPASAEAEDEDAQAAVGAGVQAGDQVGGPPTGAAPAPDPAGNGGAAPPAAAATITAEGPAFPHRPVTEARVATGYLGAAPLAAPGASPDAGADLTDKAQVAPSGEPPAVVAVHPSATEAPPDAPAPAPEGGGQYLLSAPVLILPSAGADSAPALVQPRSDQMALLQPGGTAAQEDSATGVVLDQISYGSGGDVLLRGRARTGHAVRIYGDGRMLATVPVRGGGWEASLPRGRVEGLSLLRADEIGPAGQVTSRVEAPFRYSGGRPLVLRDREVIVQRGDNLWEIAEAYYGDGIRYSLIYGANSSLIRDPDLIYPDQVFTIPELVEAE